MMPRCDRNCFACRFLDCIDASFSPSDYLELVELERDLGIFQPEDEKYFLLDLVAVTKLEEKRKRASARRKIDRSKKRKYHARDTLKEV
jgi:hypothetical protein